MAKKPARPLSKLERLQAAIDGHPVPMTKAQQDELKPYITTLIAAAALGAAYSEYRHSGNPLHFLEGFVSARRGGVPIPDWILKGFTVAIEKFLAAKGTITLDAAFGFKRKPGPRSRWTEHDQRQEDDRLTWLIERELKKGLKLTGDPGAVDVVAKILGKLPEQSDSLKQRYEKILKTRPSRLRP